MQKILLVSTGYYRGEKTHIDQLLTLSNNYSFDLICNMQEQTSNEKTYSLSIFSAFKIINKIKKNNYSCIHCHGFRAALFIRSLTYISTLPPIIYTIHGFHCGYQKWHPKAIMQRLLERLLKKVQSHTICVSQSDFNIAKKLHCIDTNKTSVIYNGISKQSNENLNSPYDELTIEKNSIICVTTGTIEWRKGYDIIIEAANKCTSIKNLKFIFIGDGPLISKLKKIVSEKKLSQKIYFVGHKKNVDAWLKHANIYITASRWEGLPYGILEAFKYQLPTIASESPGHIDCIENKKSGLLFEKNNSNELSSCIHQIVNNSKLKESLIFGANQQLKTIFNEQLMISEINKIYDQYKF